MFEFFNNVIINPLSEMSGTMTNVIQMHNSTHIWVLSLDPLANLIYYDNTSSTPGVHPKRNNVQ